MLNLVENISNDAENYNSDSLQMSINAFNELHTILIDAGLKEDPEITIVKEAIIELDSIMSLNLQFNRNTVNFSLIYNFIVGLFKTKGKYTTKKNVVLYLEYLYSKLQEDDN